MKKLIISLIVLLSSITAFGQSYQPFDFEKGMWYCRYVTKGGMFGADFERTQYVTDSVKFYCNGDTVINNFIYKKLYYSGFLSVQYSDRNPVSGYYTAIRNDTLNKKVLFVPAGYDSSYSGPGIVLYDFNIAVGDSIGYNYTTSKKDTVTSIDSVVYCNRAHRRFNSKSGENTIIEGIGSMSGLFPIVSPTDYGTLLCYQEYGNTDCEDYNIFTAVSSIILNEFDVYPNPFNDFLVIENPGSEPLTAEIIDLNGKVIIKEHAGPQSKKIDTKHIKTGFYILKITSDSAISTQTIIKQ